MARLTNGARSYHVVVWRDEERTERINEPSDGGYGVEVAENGSLVLRGEHECGLPTMFTRFCEARAVDVCMWFEAASKGVRAPARTVEFAVNVDGEGDPRPVFSMGPTAYGPSASDGIVFPGAKLTAVKDSPAGVSPLEETE
jgi:hypothetical protein